MDPQKIYDKYKDLVGDLSRVASDTQSKVLGSEPDRFFIDNVNLLSKSYLIVLCSYLEAYLKELAEWHVNRVRGDLGLMRIPHNLVYWSIVRESVKDKELKFADFDVDITSKHIDDEISGNPGRTIKLFGYLGVDLSVSADFNSNKSLVGSVVDKRNKIVHHNDSATGLTLGDVSSYASTFLVYMNAVKVVVTV